METFDDKLLKEAAWAEMTQRNQREKTEQTVAAVSAALRGESAAADARMDELDALLLQAEQLAGAAGLSEDADAGGLCGRRAAHGADRGGAGIRRDPLF